ncbi:HEPN domain-containing protein [uncultured Methanoregula sp.]|uniref:HEPN domain-containing protein n=1 Tax=uncultured Methanoregula sp. TaxID=1005933 RepID=UPI002AAB53DF|nr:HEPN domain-containing protein [uncultured Methanoregula sp.]
MTEALKNPQFAHNLLAMASLDLKAARALHKEGIYPQAVFYLEQSVEKGLKSYSIALGIIDEKEAWQEISHKSLKIYEKNTKNFRQRVVNIQENLKKVPNLEAFFMQQVNFPEVVKQLNGTLDQIKMLSKQDETSLHLTKKELNSYIKTLQELHRDVIHENARIQKKPITPSEFRKSKKYLTDMLEAVFVNQPERLQMEKEELNRKFTFDIYEKLMKDVLTQSIPPIETFQSFFQLSIILQPHAVARYPKSDFNPLELYTPDLPLIKSFTKLADITERVLNQVDAIYQKSGRISP